MGLIICLFIIVFISMAIIGGLDIIRDARNPLPKFENGDKRIDQIVIKKTRNITLK